MGQTKHETGWMVVKGSHRDDGQKLYNIKLRDLEADDNEIVFEGCYPAENITEVDDELDDGTGANDNPYVQVTFEERKDEGGNTYNHILDIVQG